MNESLQHPQVSRMLRLVSYVLGIVFVFGIAKTVNEFKKGMYIGRDVSVQSTISVSGEGEVFAKPDIATFSFTVTESSKVVADAQKLAEDKVSAALDSVKKSGVEEKDIKTLSYTINPKYEYYYQAQPMIACTSTYCPTVPVKQPKIIGYEVSQTIEVKVRKIADAGTILSDVGAANVSNVSGLTFSIDKEDNVRAEARDKAIRQAREKAEVLAKSLGVSLVRVISYSEGRNYPMYYAKEAMGMSMDAATAAPAVSVPTGENQIMSNVTVTYEIR
jgi:uncharacterized protein YggE